MPFCSPLLPFRKRSLCKRWRSVQKSMCSTPSQRPWRQGWRGGRRRTAAAPAGGAAWRRRRRLRRSPLGRPAAACGRPRAAGDAQSAPAAAVCPTAAPTCSPKQTGGIDSRTMWKLKLRRCPCNAFHTLRKQPCFTPRNRKGDPQASPPRLSLEHPASSTCISMAAESWKRPQPQHSATMCSRTAPSSQMLREVKHLCGRTARTDSRKSRQAASP